MGPYGLLLYKLGCFFASWFTNACHPIAFSFLYSPFMMKRQPSGCVVSFLYIFSRRRWHFTSIQKYFHRSSFFRRWGMSALWNWTLRLLSHNCGLRNFEYREVWLICECFLKNSFQNSKRDLTIQFPVILQIRMFGKNFWLFFSGFGEFYTFYRNSNSCMFNIRALNLNE